MCSQRKQLSPARATSIPPLLTSLQAFSPDQVYNQPGGMSPTPPQADSSAPKSITYPAGLSHKSNYHISSFLKFKNTCFFGMDPSLFLQLLPQMTLLKYKSDLFFFFFFA